MSDSIWMSSKSFFFISTINCVCVCFTISTMTLVFPAKNMNDENTPQTQTLTQIHSSQTKNNSYSNRLPTHSNNNKNVQTVLEHNYFRYLYIQWKRERDRKSSKANPTYSKKHSELIQTKRKITGIIWKILTSKSEYFLIFLFYVF